MRSKQLRLGRAYMYGIALHGATDAFAHATYRYDFNQKNGFI